MSPPIPPAVAYEALARQAYGLALLLRDRGRFGQAAWRKAHDALRFSVTTRARSLAVPSKLTGVRATQASLAALGVLPQSFGLRLDLVRDDGPDGPRFAVRVAASTAGARLAGATLGYVQAKHVPWLLDLVPLGVEVRLSGVTGGGKRGFFGCNVHFTGVGAALARLARYGGPLRAAEPRPESASGLPAAPPSDPSVGPSAPW